MRLLPALLTAVILLACSGVKLPPTTPDQIEVFYENRGQYPQEEFKRLALLDRTYNEEMCSTELQEPCDDAKIWEFGLNKLKELAAQLGADALLVHEVSYAQSGAGQRYNSSAIYFPSRHPELEQ
jgi:hypothetical protein